MKTFKEIVLGEKMGSKYIITKTKGDREYKSPEGTLSELIAYYKSTLETGKSYEGQRGNKKINVSPKNIKQLIDNLNKAVNNSAANGYAGITYKYSEV